MRVVWAPAPLAEEGRGGVRVRVGPLPRLLPRTARGSGAVGARNPSRALWGPCFLGDARTGVLPGKAPGSAVRVQSLDGSQHSAFRVTYRTSLRPSSSGDPRCPSSRVVFFFGISGTSAPVRGGRRPFGFLRSNRGRRRDGPRTSSGGVSPPRRAASRVEGPRASSRLGRRWFSLSRRGAPVGDPAPCAAPGEDRGIGRSPEVPERRAAFRVLFGFSGPATGPAFPPSRARTPHGRRFAPMIPPQVHLRRPCYDFSFL